ncbi:MAG TPA: ABC transporter ATP-binding protein, partial [Puia sp.]
KVCTHVAILQQGVLIKSGDVGTALRRETWLELGASEMEKLNEILVQLPHIKKIVRAGKTFQVYFEENAPEADWLNQYCFERGIALNHLQVKQISLESAFIELTNNASN